MIKPGEYILVRVYNDDEEIDDTILFDDFDSSVFAEWRIELHEEEERQ